MSGTSVILVTHNLAQLPRLCDHTLFLSPENPARVLSVEEGINAYLHATDFKVTSNAAPLVLAPSLASASIFAEPCKLTTFEKLTIAIELEVLAACEVGLIVGNFETADGREGAEFPRDTAIRHWQVAALERNQTTETDLNELPFASGQYILNLAIFDQTPKGSTSSFRSGGDYQSCRSSQITSFPNVLRSNECSHLSVTKYAAWNQTLRLRSHRTLGLLCCPDTSFFGAGIRLVTHEEDKVIGQWVRGTIGWSPQDLAEYEVLISYAKSCRTIVDVGSNIETGGDPPCHERRRAPDLCLRTRPSEFCTVSYQLRLE